MIAMLNLIRIAPLVSFLFCMLGGAALLLAGLDQGDFAWCGLGLFCIGVAFFIGPTLGMIAELRCSKVEGSAESSRQIESS